MRWFVVSIVGVVAVAGFFVTLLRRRDHEMADVGAVSDDWIAQHRAGTPDAF